MDLYLDFDGVLVDTIDVTYEMMRKLQIDIDGDKDSVNKFYRQLDWFKLLNNISQINESFKWIEEIKKSGLYNSSNILTTVTSLKEISAKINYIRKFDKDIRIISVPKGVEKKDLVNPKNSILVDDYSGNLTPWSSSGGIPIKFSNRKNDKFITINSLKYLTEESFVKKLKKAI